MSLDSTVSQVQTELREKKAQYIIGGLATLILLLFGVIWHGWLYEIFNRTGTVVPRRVLGAFIGILAIGLLTFILLSIRYYRAWKRLLVENRELLARIEPLSTLPQKLQEIELENQQLKDLIQKPSHVLEPPNVKLRQALARLKSLNDNLPTGNIQEKYVADYHSILSVIQQETGHDLTCFFISPTELKRHLISSGRPRMGNRFGSEPTYSQVRHCDRPVFLTQLHSAIKFITDFLPE
ncbi:MAG TPA: hypothetical protein VGB05_03765 [Pyrinomonadaceae bacterium]